MATSSKLESPSSNQWTEPESTIGLYPYNNTTQTESGHSSQFDDTPDFERIRFQHRVGTFIDMHPNGDEVHKVFGDGYEITIKNKNVLIKGVCNLEVVGDCNMNVGGDYNLRVDGDFNLTTKGVMKVGVKKKIDIQTDAQLFLKSTQPAGIGVQIDGGGSGGSIVMNSNVEVFADLKATNLRAIGTTGLNGRVDAAGGMGAGLLGFSTSGGVSVGMPVGATVPGQVLASVSVTAPVAAFKTAFIGSAFMGISSSVLGADLINDIFYNTHFHPTPKGPTGLTVVPFLGV
jgi:hypothetical protein